MLYNFKKALGIIFSTFLILATILQNFFASYYSDDTIHSLPPQVKTSFGASCLYCDFANLTLGSYNMKLYMIII